MHAPSLNKMAFQATVHCLIGCAIGEVLGLVIGTAFGFSNLATIILSIVLAFVFGYGLSLRSVTRSGVAFSAALTLVLAADTLSITTMEITDTFIMLVIPGAMGAGLADWLFWLSMAFSLVVAFVAAYPVNRYLLSKHKGHALLHPHRTHHHQ